jgi:hypothetical protein
MATLAQNQARLESLKAARDTGALRVRHGDTDTTFRSLDELERIIAQLEGTIATQSGSSRKRVTYIRQDSKGYGQ